jgi:hypothetical protein
MFYKIFKIILLSLIIFSILTLIPKLVFKNSDSIHQTQSYAKTRISSLSEIPDWDKYPIVSAKKVNRILVLTQARSGSTFLGLKSISKTHSN